jgi:hypothetical protein
MSDAHQPVNRLAAESSPYLRQHQHNPVDWYPWGPEAFEAARKLNRPIFLSVGYSTCYWCHVMERQCFENHAIAAEMNQRFISIKVDREERPDVDQLYMTAVQLLTRQGGWPMSVFLTPDLRPFYGGTYFPPTDQYGRPGFPTLLRSIDNAWQTRVADVQSSADQLILALSRLAEPTPPQQPLTIDSRLIDQLIDRSVSDYDSRHGGFGGAPKFPRQTLLELLLTYSAPSRPASVRTQNVREMLLHTFDALARGGIRDHLGGGFHRYSTDAEWLVPHFEIMLYDNAMLAWCYVEAFRQTGDPRWAAVARGIFDFVLREMTSPGGAFYTAFDAEVDAMEGASYLWTRAEVLEILAGPTASESEDAELFCRVYGLSDGPNFADPHHGNGTPDKNVLCLPRSLEDLAIDMRIDVTVLHGRLASQRGKLLKARAARKQPSLDTKILTSWNALMIRAFATGGSVLKVPEYLTAAERAASFLLDHHLAEDGMLLRTSGGLASPTPATRPPIPGFLDDYAFFTQALLALHDATSAERWKSHAERILNQMTTRFGDANITRGFFFTDASAKELIVRQKTATDSPFPSGNGVAARVLLATGRDDAARETVAAFAGSMEMQGESMSALLNAAMAYVDQIGLIEVAPPMELSETVRPASPMQMAADVVSVSASMKGNLLQVDLSIRPGWHINAYQVAGPSPLIATSLHVSRSDASIVYPVGEERTFPFSDQALRVYTGKVGITVRFASEIPPDVPLELTLSYQPCDDSSCLPAVQKRIVLGAS